MTEQRPLIFGLFLSTLLWTSPAALAETALVGPPEVILGDVLEVQGQRLRLVGIDAPEAGQNCALGERLYDCGLVSRSALLDLTAGVEVRCQVQSETGEALPQARCFAEDYDLSEGMVYTGWALADPEGGSAYQAFQQEAESKGHGLWRGRFVPPWDWVKGARLPEEN